MFGVSLGVAWVAPRAYPGIQRAAWKSFGAAEGTLGAPRGAQAEPSEATSDFDKEGSGTAMGVWGPLVVYK